MADLTGKTNLTVVSVLFVMMLIGGPSIPAPSAFGEASSEQGPGWSPERLWELVATLEALDDDGVQVELDRLSRMPESEQLMLQKAALEMELDELDQLRARLHTLVDRSSDSKPVRDPVAFPVPRPDELDLIATSAMPELRMGVDSPLWTAVHFNIKESGVRDSKECIPGTAVCFEVCFDGVCYDSTTRAHEYKAAVVEPYFARTYSSSASLYDVRRLPTFSTIYEAITAEVSGREPIERQAWAALGVQYDVVPACSAQGQTVQAVIRANFALQGYLDATSGFASFAYADYHLDIKPFSSSPDPLDDHDSALLVHFNRLIAPQLTAKGLNVLHDRTWSTVDGISVGPGGTYAILSSESYALAGPVGLSRGYSDFNFFGTWLRYIEIDWLDDTAPSGSAALHGAEGRNGWYRSNVDVEIIATDPETCGAAAHYQVDDASWMAVALDNWDSNTRVPLTSDGVYFVQYQVRNHNGMWSSTKAIPVHIDKTSPSVAMTRPDDELLILQGAGVSVFGLQPTTVIAGTSLVLKADATDPVVNGASSGVYEVRFYSNGNLLGSDRSAPYEWSWNLLLETGTHELSVCAEDRAGNVACYQGPDVIVVG